MISHHTSRARRALRGAALAALSAVALAGCDADIEEPFEIEGTGNISGLLFFDEGRDGEFEPVEGDSALANIGIALRVRGTNEVLASTTTDAAGHFTFTGIAIGTHDLEIDADDVEGVAVICQNPRPVSVRISEVTSVVVSGQESCLITITEAREQSLGTLVTVRGVVTVGSGDLSASYFFVQDATAGIKVFTPASTEVGQLLEITGNLDVFSGELEIINAQITNLGTAPLPDPTELTGAEFASHDFQGTLAVVRGLEVTGVPDLGGQAPGVSYNVNVVAPDGTNFIIRVDSDAAITPGTFVLGETYDVIGVVSPFGGAEQLYVRSNADIDQI
jgi:hypothetical protein